MTTLLTKLPSLEVFPDSCTVEEFAQKVSSQHVIVTYGDYTEAIRDFCKMMDIELVLQNPFSPQDCRNRGSPFLFIWKFPVLFSIFLFTVRIKGCIIKKTLLWR